MIAWGSPYCFKFSEEVTAEWDWPESYPRHDTCVTTSTSSSTRCRSGLEDPAGESELAQLDQHQGRHWATHGVPLHEAIEGYHMGYREVWNLLLGLGDQDLALTAGLAGEATLLWNLVPAAVQSLLTNRLAMRQRLVRSLADETATAEQRGDLARRLGFDAESDFLVVCTALR